LRLPAREPVRRYERARPGEPLHVDIKKLGRFWTIGKRIYGDRLARSRRAGWQYLHLAIDDHSRLAYCELLPSESPDDCVAFLRRTAGRARRSRRQQRSWKPIWIPERPARLRRPHRTTFRVTLESRGLREGRRAVKPAAAQGGLRSRCSKVPRCYRSCPPVRRPR